MIAGKGSGGKALVALIVGGMVLFGVSFVSGWDSYRFDVIGYGAASGRGSHDAWKAELPGAVAAIPVLGLASSAVAASMYRRRLRHRSRGLGMIVLGMTTAAAFLAGWAVSGGRRESLSERFHLVVQPGTTAYLALALALAMSVVALWIVAGAGRRDLPGAPE